MISNFEPPQDFGRTQLRQRLLLVQLKLTREYSHTIVEQEQNHGRPGPTKQLGLIYWPVREIEDHSSTAFTEYFSGERYEFGRDRTRYSCKMDRSYKKAIEILNRSRRQRRPSIEPAQSFPGLTQMPSLNGESDMKGVPSIVGMRQWLDQLGHSTADINSLNIIHIAGTKGKGSTAAFIDSFLRVYGRRTGFPRKTGLYTSPHLLYPEERIRINFEPLPRDLFTKYFYEVHDLLAQNRNQGFQSPPRYLQFFALLSFHTFIREGVDAAVFETHHGGEYDSTNFIENPIVTAITPLGLDHIKQLGPSIQNIAWHKSGIFKPGASAFSAPQESAASKVLQNRACEKGVNLKFIDNDPSLPADALHLKPDVQRANCSLALAVVRSFLDQKADQSHSSLSSDDICQGINQFCWPGRFQLVVEDKHQWFLDGAHNEISVVKAAEWFIEISKLQRVTSPVVRILIFSQISDQRDGAAVFERLASSLASYGIQYLIFTTYERDQKFDSGIDSQPQIFEMPSQEVYSAIWKNVQPDTSILFQPTIRGALEIARKIGDEHGGTQSLITGSLRLVGGALGLLKPNLSAQDSIPELESSE